MSQPPKRKADAAASKAGAAKRATLRSFAAASAASSHIRQVDQSLRCVFGCLDLADLSRVLAVSKQWSGNVCAMPPISASVSSRLRVQPLWLSVLCASSLARQVWSLEISRSRSAADLVKVCTRMPALRQLELWLNMGALALGAGLLTFPQRLTKLELSLAWRGASDDVPHAPLIQRVLNSIGALASLEELTLAANSDDESKRAEMSFEPLRALHRLHRLEFTWSSWTGSWSRQTFSGAQLDCLRHLANQHALVNLSLFTGEMDCMLRGMVARNETEPLLVHFLGLSHTHLGVVHAPALRCLPALRILSPPSMEVIDFLPSMPHLHTLVLHPSDESEVTADQLVSALAPLTQLTSLELGMPAESAITADQLVDVIQPLTRLTSLRVGSHATLSEAHLTRMLAPLTLLEHLVIDPLPCLRSLSFLSSGAITHSLTEFLLFDCHADLRSSELRHLHACKRLTKIELGDAFRRKLTAADRLFYAQRPCPALPALQEFVIRSDDEKDDEDDDEEEDHE